MRKLPKLVDVLLETPGNIAWDDDYPVFVKKLAAHADDPEMQKFIGAGHKDGDPKDDRFKTKPENIAVADLIPTQNEIDIDKSLGWPMKKDPSSFIKFSKGNGPFLVGADPIIVLNKTHILDGHHRWSQVYAINRDAELKVQNINKPGLDPHDALKSIQAAVALKTGEVKVAEVKGANMLQMSKDDLEEWIGKKVNMKFFATIGSNKEIMEILRKKTSDLNEADDVDESDFRDAQNLVLNCIWKNVESMQKTSQPIAGATPRGLMPQTDAIDWEAPLQTGQVDIAEPHAKMKEGSSDADDELVMERWLKLSGLLKS